MFESEKRRGNSTVTHMVNNAYEFFKIGLNVSSEIWLTLTKGKRNISPSDVPQLSVATTNFVFSIELYLKAIHRLCNSLPDGHQMNHLYKTLPVTVKDSLNEYYVDHKRKSLHSLGSYIMSVTSQNLGDIDLDVKDDNSLKDMFKSHNHAFARWRYIFEEDKPQPAYVNFDSLWCAVFAMIDTVDELMVFRKMVEPKDVGRLDFE